MTPQEKAIDLIDKYHLKVNVLYTQDSNPAVMNGAMTVNSSKQCALIAVDELIESFNSIYDASIRNIEKYSGAKYGMRDYWEEVKKEIEKL